MATIDLSLANAALYAGLPITEVAGRKNLAASPADAIPIFGRNLAAFVRAVPSEDRADVTLTGPMAVWAYLLAFHAVVHSFGRVYYDDGKSGPVLVAQHGA